MRDTGQYAYRHDGEHAENGNLDDDDDVVENDASTSSERVQEAGKRYCHYRKTSCRGILGCTSIGSWRAYYVVAESQCVRCARSNDHVVDCVEGENEELWLLNEVVHLVAVSRVSVAGLQFCTHVVHVSTIAYNRHSFVIDRMSRCSQAELDVQYRARDGCKSAKSPKAKRDPRTLGGLHNGPWCSEYAGTDDLLEYEGHY